MFIFEFVDNSIKLAFSNSKLDVDLSIKPLQGNESTNAWTRMS